MKTNMKMAKILRNVILFTYCAVIVVATSESIPPDGESICCETTCSNTYTLHTYPQSEHLESCLRGCRFFSIIDTVEEYNDLNATRSSCAVSCRDAYDEEEDIDDQHACVLGCDSQQPFFSPLERHMLNEIDNMFRPPAFDMSVMFPFLYGHDIYSNIIDKFNQRTQVSWSFYMQNSNGQMVVIKSAPEITEYYWNGDMTHNYMETNIGAMDDSATPDFHYSPFFDAKPYKLEDRDISLSERDSKNSELQSDWLSCVSNKTGLPKMLLTFAIFLSAMGMIWLCITTTVTASEQRVHTKPQSVSMYGDLEYLKQLDGKGLLTKITPIGPEVQAPPLPIKLNVQRI